jgi:hypothetical protein
MKAIAQNKLTKKLLLLFVLIGALIYLRQPDQAEAYGCPCIVGCISGYSRCVALCNGNQTCINGCKTQETQCDNHCYQTQPNCCPNPPCY